MASVAEPVFASFEDAMRNAGLLGEPAEVHGELCGLFCVMGTDAGPAWVAQVMADSSGAGAQIRDLLEGLAATTFQALDAGDMTLRLLIPGDQESLETRAEHLGLWCQGFVHGLGAAGKTGSDNPLLTNEVTGEIIADFTQITRATFGAEESEAEGEAAYAELVEFVRVSVQLSYEELHLLRKPADNRREH